MKRFAMAALFLLTGVMFTFGDSAGTRLLAEAELKVFPVDSSPAIANLPPGTLVEVVEPGREWTRIRFSDSEGAAIEGYAATVLLESDEAAALQSYNIGVYLLMKNEANRAAVYFLYFYESELPRLQSTAMSGGSIDPADLSRVGTAAASLSRFSASYSEKYTSLIEIAEMEVVVPMMYNADPVFITKLIESLYRAGAAEEIRTGLSVISLVQNLSQVRKEDESFFADYKRILQSRLAEAEE
ncbi:MAG: hypothetical protein HN368_11935 [Spirochaetales bacterium]|nr:hypothetical protein [Spirochaetales bacterium]